MARDFRDTTFPSCLRLLAAAVLLFWAAGCGEVPEIERGQYELPKDVRIADCEPGRYGGSFIMSTMSAPQGFNFLGGISGTTHRMLNKIMGTLLEYDPVKEEFTPALAKSWSSDESMRKYTFQLREGVRWSDGHPFTADDIIFTFDVIAAQQTDEKTGKLIPLYPTKYYSKLQYGDSSLGYRKLDDYTLEIETPHIYSGLLYDLHDMMVLPKHALETAHKRGELLEQWSLQTAIESPESIVGLGPFVVESYRPAERLVLKPNPHYWKADSAGQRLPYVDRLIYKYVGESTTQVMHAATGKVSGGAVGPSSVGWVREAESVHNFTLIERGPASMLTAIYMNLNPGSNDKDEPYVDPVKSAWLRDKRFRQAMLYGFNRQGVIEATYFGGGAIAHSSITEALGKWHNSNVKRYDYDPERALSMLREAGFQKNSKGELEDAEGNRVSLDLTMPNGGGWEDMVLVYKENMAELGIEIVLQAAEFATMIRKMDYTFDFELMVLSWGYTSAAYDPAEDQSFYLSSGKDHTWNPKQVEPATEWEARIDELYKVQERTFDMEKRIAAMHEVQDIMAENVPVITMISPLSYVTVRNHWKNLKVPNAGPFIWNIEEIWTENPDVP